MTVLPTTATLSEKLPETETVKGIPETGSRMTDADRPMTVFLLLQGPQQTLPITTDGHPTMTMTADVPSPLEETVLLLL